MGTSTRANEHHPHHGEASQCVLHVTAQHHSRQARPQSTGTTASGPVAKMVTGGIPGHGVDWVSSVVDSVPDHRNFEIALAVCIAASLVMLTLSKF